MRPCTTDLRVTVDDSYCRKMSFSEVLPKVTASPTTDLEKTQDELWSKREERNNLTEPLKNTPEHIEWSNLYQNLTVEIQKLEKQFSLQAAEESMPKEALSLTLSRFSQNSNERRLSLYTDSSSCGFANTFTKQQLDEVARADITFPTHVTNTEARCCGYLVGKPLGSGAFSSVRKGYFGCSFKSPEAVRLIVAKLIETSVPDEIMSNYLQIEFEYQFTLNELIYDFMRGEDNEGPGAEKVAVKLTLKPEAGTKTRFTHDNQFKMELSVFKHVRNKHVIRCYALNPSFSFAEEAGGQKEDYYAMCLELCEHGNLFDFVYYNKPLDEKLARTLFLQVIDGVQALHRKDFVHRDIKPQNIVLDSDYNLKICDFGSSWKMTSSSIKQYSLGTRGFRAPEIVLKHPYSNKCDAFSCGVLLFVMLTKLMPEIDEATPADKLYRYVAQRDFNKFWRLLSTKVPGLSSEVKNLLQNLLTYQPNDRVGILSRTNSKGVFKPGVLDDPWCKGEVYSPEELRPIMEELHNNAMAKKKEKKEAERAKKEEESN